MIYQSNNNDLSILAMMVLSGVVCSSLVWCGLVWSGVVWCGLAWSGVICMSSVSLPGSSPWLVRSSTPSTRNLDGSSWPSLSPGSSRSPYPSRSRPAWTTRIAGPRLPGSAPSTMPTSLSTPRWRHSTFPASSWSFFTGGLSGPSAWELRRCPPVDRPPTGPPPKPLPQTSDASRQDRRST